MRGEWALLGTIERGTASGYRGCKRRGGQGDRTPAMPPPNPSHCAGCLPCRCGRRSRTQKSWTTSAPRTHGSRCVCMCGCQRGRGRACVCAVWVRVCAPQLLVLLVLSAGTASTRDLHATRLPRIAASRTAAQAAACADERMRDQRACALVAAAPRALRPRCPQWRSAWTARLLCGRASRGRLPATCPPPPCLAPALQGLRPPASSLLAPVAGPTPLL